LRERELPRGQADNLRRALETAQEYAEEPADWLVFNSVGYGNGKTHLAAAIANHIANQGEAVLFIVVPDLLDHLRAAFNPASGVRYDKRFDEVKKAPILVLDDLGTESATAWAREKLYQLFNYRYTARLPTVITTATPIDEIDPRLQTRMLDGSRCTFFLLEVPSYRGGGRRRQQRQQRPETVGQGCGITSWSPTSTRLGLAISLAAISASRVNAVLAGDAAECFSGGDGVDLSGHGRRRISRLLGLPFLCFRRRFYGWIFLFRRRFLIRFRRGGRFVVSGRFVRRVTFLFLFNVAFIGGGVEISEDGGDDLVKDVRP
jgi:hypothetical protein